MKKKKLLVYPYSRSTEPFIKYHDLIKDYEIQALVSPKGWGIAGDTIDTLDGAFAVTDKFEEELKRCDVVWFVEDGTCTLSQTILDQRMDEAKRAGREMLFFQKERTLKYQIDAPYLNRMLGNEVPVISVIGNFRDANKMEVQLGLRYEFMKRGYRVSSIFSSSGGELAGGYSFPDFMEDPELSAAQKTVRYNQLVKLISVEENPDVIIIGVPGGVIPYSDELHNDFGIYAFEISNAVASDFTILCSLYSPNLSWALESEKEIIERKFSWEIGAVHVAPYIWDRDDDIGNNNGGMTIEVDDAFLYKKLPDLDQGEIWNLRKYHNIQRLADKIMEELGGGD